MAPLHRWLVGLPQRLEGKRQELLLRSVRKWIFQEKGP
jgi:hypothetical protein